MSIRVFISNARLSTYNLWKAGAFEEGQEVKYGADFIFGPDTKFYGYKTVEVDGKPKLVVDRSKTINIKQVFVDVANSEWKGKGVEMLKSFGKNEKALRDGNAKLDKSGNVKEGYEDALYLAAKKPEKHGRPLYVNQEGTGTVDEKDGTLYSGAYVNGVVDIYAVNNGKIKGVHAKLVSIQKLRDGDAFSGGAPASMDDYEAVTEGAAAPDMDDDIPF
jgi:hypothetical protein